jgi:hypothetical protein
MDASPQPTTIDTELAAAKKDVERTFEALKNVQARFNRCRRQDSRDALRPDLEKAEAEYRTAARKRDEVVARRRSEKQPDDRPAACSACAIGLGDWAGAHTRSAGCSFAPGRTP